MKARAAVALAFGVLLDAAAAQAEAAPALIGKTPEGVSVGPLALSKVIGESVIAGFLAETTMTLTFRNALDEVLEGELLFPLPEGATVSGFALDVAGELVDGVIVEKHQARIAFEAESRRRIDPGLVEWVRGSTYRTRVYPVPARGERTVRLRYVEDLGARSRDGGRESLYRLPLSFGQVVGELSVRIEVAAEGARPRLVSSVIPGLEFRAENGRAVAFATMRDRKAAEDIVLAFPVTSAGGVLVEPAEDEHYFVVEDFPVAPAPPRTPAPKPRRVALLWDASYSSSGDERRRELRLLEQWVPRAGALDVDVIVFRDVVDKPRSFTIAGGRAAAMLEYLRRQPLDGGTRLGALRFPKNPAGYGLTSGAAGSLPDYDYALLVSDGLSTLGPEALPSSAVPVYALSASREADHAWLRHLADRSGGRYLNLQDVGDDVALAAIGAPVFSFLALECDGAQVRDVLPGSRRAVDGRFLLSGRLLAPEASVRIRYGYADGSAPVVRDFTLRQGGATGSGLVPRLWAQQKVSELSVSAEQNRAELLSLGRRFHIVTPGTSLLVLETVEQYVEHGIEPPRSRAGFYEQFVARRAEHARAKAEALENKRARVLEAWNERVERWSRDFRYEDPKRAVEPAREEPDLEGPPTVFSATTAVAVAVSAGFAAGGLEESEEAEQPSGLPVIQLEPWDPKAPYLDAMKQAGLGRAYDVYLALRPSYRASPSFFLDCAGFFFRNKWPGLARRVLTNVLELRIDDPRVVRIAAHRLGQAGEWSLAVDLFEKVLALRPEEPQSHRDLALALEARADAQRSREGGLAQAAAADYARALELLNGVVVELWDDRFDGIEVVALMEANRILGVMEREGHPAATTARLAPELRKPLEADVRVVLTWDTDATDMDLRVIEPTGEQCDYTRTRTSSGGAISDDLTGGYGPEEYVVRRALPGTYTIKAHYYGSSAGPLAGPAIVQATVITDFGRRNERRQALTLRLSPEGDADEEAAEDTVEVGTVQYSSLAQALRAADPEQRRAAVALLGRGDNEAEASTALHAALKDASSVVRSEAATALWRLAGCPRCADAERLLRLLRSELANGRGDARLVTLRYIEALGPSSIPDLARLLADPDVKVAAFAARALTRFGPEAIPALRPHLKDGRSEVRLQAVKALVRMRPVPREALAELEALAADGDEDPAVRREASSALPLLDRAKVPGAAMPPPDAQVMGAITHLPIGCFVAGEFPLVDAWIEPAWAVARARVYFRSDLGSAYYFVEMIALDGRFVGTLPRPKVEASPFTYYIFAITTDGVESQTAEVRVLVVDDASQCPAGQRIAEAGPSRRLPP